MASGRGRTFVAPVQVRGTAIPGAHEDTRHNVPAPMSQQFEEMIHMSKTQRMSISKVAPGAYKAVMPLQKFAETGTVDPKLLLLIQIRASQLNHCAWCLDMHTDEARKAGVSQRQIDVVAAWHEAGDLFTEQERAVLAFAEQVTQISDGVSDEVWGEINAYFTPQEVVQLLMATAAINVWNRMNVTALTSLPDRQADLRW